MLIAMWTEDFESDPTLGIMEECYQSLKAKSMSALSSHLARCSSSLQQIINLNPLMSLRPMKMTRHANVRRKSYSVSLNFLCKTKAAVETGTNTP